MTEPIELNYGAGKEYRVVARAETGDGGYFNFSEKFFESSDPKYDAILLLGAQLNHDYIEPVNQDVVTSWMWRGFSKKARSISRMFVYSIHVSMDIASAIDDVFTCIDSSVTTVDYGNEYIPNHGSDGVLAHFQRCFIYEIQTAGSSAVYHLMNHSGFDWYYPNLEVTFPIGFYHYTRGYGDIPKQAWIFWKVTAFVRFMGSQKANPSFSKGISFGGTPG